MEHNKPKSKFRSLIDEGKDFLFDSKNENNRMDPQPPQQAPRKQEQPQVKREMPQPVQVQAQTAVMETPAASNQEAYRYANTAEQLMEQAPEREGRFDTKVKLNENPNMDFCSPAYYEAIVEICNEIHGGKSAIVDFSEAEAGLRSKMIQYLVGFCHGRQIHIEMLKTNWFAVDPNFSTEETMKSRR